MLNGLWHKCIIVALVLLSFYAKAQHDPKDSILLGNLTVQDLKENCKWFSERYNAYQPDDSSMQLLKPIANQLSFIVVLGTWCSDSKEHVPAFFKVINQLEIPENRIVMHGVARLKYRVLTKELKKLHFEYVPTIIVYRNKKEVGRIIEDTKKSIEHDLMKMMVEYK